MIRAIRDRVKMNWARGVPNDWSTWCWFGAVEYIRFTSAGGDWWLKVGADDDKSGPGEGRSVVIDRLAAAGERSALCILVNAGILVAAVVCSSDFMVIDVKRILRWCRQRE